jgi:hypothetical protein
VSIQVQLVDPPDGGSLALVDGQALLSAPAIAEPLRGHGLVAERCRRAVEESLPGVLPHGPAGVLGVLGALVLVEHRDHAPDHLARGVVAGLLGDGDHLDPVLLELALVESEDDAVPEEPGEAVDDDGVEGWRRPEGVGHQGLEGRPLVVRGGRAGLDVFHGDQVIVGLAPLPQLAQLVGDRQVLFRLSGGGDAGVEGNGHGASLRGFAGFLEQQDLPHQLGQVAAQDVDLGVRQRVRLEILSPTYRNVHRLRSPSPGWHGFLRGRSLRRGPPSRNPLQRSLWGTARAQPSDGNVWTGTRGMAKNFSVPEKLTCRQSVGPGVCSAFYFAQRSELSTGRYRTIR